MKTKFFPKWLWRLASLAVVLATLIGGVDTAYAIPPEPIDDEPDEPAEVPDHFTWNMLARFGQDSDGDGVTDYHYDSAFVNPATFTVRFKGCPYPGTGLGNQYAWEIDGTRLGTTNCMFNYDLTPGLHHVRFTATPASGTGHVYEEDILVRDILVVSLGDSYASGEGNPDIRQQFDWLTGQVWASARWVDRRCHRSAYAGPAQAALALERADPHTSVTFVSLACSGAQLSDLVSAGYMGPEPGPGDTPLKAQLEVLQQIVGPRRIDSLVISGGGNDVGFGDIIADCVTGSACHQDALVLARLAADLTSLRGDYWGVTDWIAYGPDGYEGPEPGINVADVYLTEYPTSVRALDGSVCPYVVDDILWPLSVDQAESTWAEASVLGPLNATMFQAVDNAAAWAPFIGWHTVDGISDAFAGSPFGHGYCVNGIWGGWVRTAFDSVHVQGPLLIHGKPAIWDLKDTKGTMHPTERGHQVYRDRILAFLLPDLFPGQSLPLGPSFSGASASGSTIDEFGNNGWVTGSCIGATCTSNQVVLEVAAADAAGISSTTVVVDGVPACDSSSVSGVTCTEQALDAQHYIWRFNITSEGNHLMEFAARNGTDQVATFTQELKVDLTDPTATATITDAVPNAAGWYNVPVSVTLSGGDTAGALGLGSGVYRVEYTLDGVAGQVSAGEAVPIATDGVHTLDYRSVDVAGRRSVMQTLTVRVDPTPPAVTVTGVTEGSTSILGAVPQAGCSTTDEGSGVAVEASLSLSGGDAQGVGSFIATCSGALDNAGNPGNTAVVHYNVTFLFTGFTSPVDNAPIMNIARAGQTIPLKWRLTDANGNPITNLTDVTVTATSLACDAGTTGDLIEEYTQGDSGLQNLGDGYYQWNWKTPTSYANSCKTVSLDLGESAGSEHTALFQFKR